MEGLAAAKPTACMRMLTCIWRSAVPTTMSSSTTSMAYTRCRTRKGEGGTNTSQTDTGQAEQRNCASPPACVEGGVRPAQSVSNRTSGICCVCTGLAWRRSQYLTVLSQLPVTSMFIWERVGGREDAQVEAGIEREATALLGQLRACFAATRDGTGCPQAAHAQLAALPPHIPALCSHTWRMKNACRTGAACCATCCCWLVCRFHIFTPLSHPPAGRVAEQMYHSLMLWSHMVPRAEQTPQYVSIACPPPPLECRAAPANTMLPSPLQALHITGLSAVMAALGMAWPLLCTSQHSTCMGSQERKQRERTVTQHACAGQLISLAAHTAAQSCPVAPSAGCQSQSHTCPDHEVATSRLLAGLNLSELMPSLGGDGTSASLLGLRQHGRFT